MSAALVRSTFRDQLSTLLGADGFAFIESINHAESTKNLPFKWYTLDFLASDDSRMSLGMPALFRETGRVTVLIFTPLQTLDTDGIAAAEKVRAALCNFFDDTGNLRVLAAEPPTELDGGDYRGSFYGITVDLAYQFDRIA
jgi:hypothetical protein